LLTIAELLAGKRIDYPPTNASYRQAEPVGAIEAESYPLFHGHHGPIPITLLGASPCA
jgi:hypothetical protein